MNYLRKMQLDKIFKQIADDEGISVHEVKEEMQKSINAADYSEDPKTKQLIKDKFGNRTPTPEEFIMLIVNELR